jgi:hypothetical protein
MRRFLPALLALLPLAAQEGKVDAAFFFGIKASNYYREQGAWDTFFGQRGFLLLETARAWAPWRADRPTGLYGGFLLEGKNESVFNPEGSNGLLDYSKKVIKETGNYSAEVGLRQALWGTEQSRFYLQAGAIFRNVTQKEVLTQDPAFAYSDRSRASNKVSALVRTETGDFIGSFVELGLLKDEFYEQAQQRLLIRGRLSYKPGFLGTAQVFFEGAINRGRGQTVVQEKDESVIMVGVHIPLGVKS